MVLRLQNYLDLEMQLKLPPSEPSSMKIRMNSAPHSINTGMPQRLYGFWCRIKAPMCLSILAQSK